MIKELENLLQESFTNLKNEDSEEKEYCVLFTDFGGSTHLVDNFNLNFSSWILKSYLSCASKIINSCGGTICAFEGDGVMALFHGKHKEIKAVNCAFKIQWAVENIIRVKSKQLFPNINYIMHQVTGVDTSKLSKFKTDIWSNYDYLWIGRAANYSATLTSINNPEFSTYITKEVHIALKDDNFAIGHDVIWEELEMKLYKTQIYQSNHTSTLQ